MFFFYILFILISVINSVGTCVPCRLATLVLVPNRNIVECSHSLFGLPSFCDTSCLSILVTVFKWSNTQAKYKYIEKGWSFEVHRLYTFVRLHPQTQDINKKSKNNTDALHSFSSRTAPHRIPTTRLCVHQSCCPPANPLRNK